MAVSLRRTLAVRFGLTMAAALLGITLLVHLQVRRSLTEQLVESLETSFELQSADLSSHGRVTAGPAPADPGELVRGLNLLVLVRDSAGAALQANHALARALPVDTAALRRALRGDRVVRPARWRGREIRAMTGPPPAGAPRAAAVLEVAAALEPVTAESRRLLARMLGIALLGALATLVGAWWLAGSALTPVHDISAQASRIGALTGAGRIIAHAEIEELGGLVRVLNEMLDRLERAAAWHRRIIRDLGHDLRTPITTMRAGVEVSLTGVRSVEHYRRVLASTLEEIDRLTLIADALSLLGRLESGALAPDPRESDLAAVAREALARARERSGGHALRLTPPTGPVAARVDSKLLGMALDQLLDNAVRHTAPGTTVELGVERAGGTAVVTVEDDGGGVPDALLPHLFERFYRADAARGREAGTGLGLSVVATIVELHRGRIAAERGRAGGLRVRIELPA